MKLAVFLLALLFTVASTQFNGFDNFRKNVADKLQQGIESSPINSILKSLPAVSNVKDFTEFVQQTGKRYADNAERQLRERVFEARKLLVEVHNRAFLAKSGTYELALNAFADITKQEFLQKLTGNSKALIGQVISKLQPQPPPKTNASVLIDSAFDWRQKGGVTPVKYQGDCGSCWSFAVTGAIEGHVFRKTGRLPNLSEQNLIDCGTRDIGLNGCDGGFQEFAFQFVHDQPGIASSDWYPYLDAEGTCSYSAGIKGAEITGYAVIKPRDEQTMKEVVATLGPLACSIYGLESLLLYKSGIYADEACNVGDVNHSVLVIGYGSENGLDYWIVKNSWDTAWGEDGYFRLPRGENFCNIALECSFPII